MTDRPFRFGVTNGAATDLAGWMAAARRAESLGYATFLMPDTLNTCAPLPALSAAAAATTTIHVGTWVLCDALRNPRTLAWEVASLDQLTGGRIELGLGAGRPGAEQDARRLGMPYGSPGARIDRLAASVTLLRSLLDGGEDGFPAATGHVPILIAASGPRLLSYAARHANTVAFGWAPTTTAEQARPLIDRVRDAAADRADDIELAAGLIAVGDDEHPWLQRLGVDAGQLASAGAVTVITGTPQQMADTLLARRDSLGLSYLTVPIQSAETFAPVVELLTGT
jgi:probable F420-dependent oxidoreductase